MNVLSRHPRLGGFGKRNELAALEDVQEEVIMGDVRLTIAVVVPGEVKAMP